MTPNPYKDGTVRSGAWKAGYEAAFADQQRIQTAVRRRALSEQEGK